MWRVSRLGGAPERVVSAVGYTISRLSVSRQGDRLAYTQLFVDTNIWRAEQPDANGRAAAPTMLISSSKSDSAPRYAPDGKRITFCSDRSGSFEIWACGADGSNPIQLTSFNGPPTASPCWSPDGRRIAFDVRSDGNPDIFVINAEGGRPQRLTEDSLTPSASRRRGVFFCTRKGGRREHTQYGTYPMRHEPGREQRVDA